MFTKYKYNKQKSNVNKYIIIHTLEIKSENIKFNYKKVNFHEKSIVIKFYNLTVVFKLTSKFTSLITRF